jgi:hypothetical protein
MSCSFTSDLSDPSAWDVEKGRFVKLYHSVDSVFEGQIEDIAYRRDKATGIYTASVNALGPWHKATITDHAANYAVATTGRTAITNALGELANISTDMTQLAESDVNVNNVTYAGKVSDCINDVCKYGTVNDYQMYFAFWATPQTGTSTAGPRAYTWARDLSTIHWRVRISEIDFQYTDSLSNVWNALKVTYNAGANITAETTNAASQALYGERQKTFDVTTQTLAVAQQARDVYLAGHYDPTPVISPFTLIGGCRDGSGVMRPLPYVRAGDIMQIEDWVNGVTFMVGATEYDADGDTCRITPEERPKTLSAMLGAITEA